MVFYPLVIRNAVEHSRRIATLNVGPEARPVEDAPRTVDSLMRKPAMAVKKVSFRGWYFSPLPSYPESHTRSVEDETLGQTLSRLHPGETLRDVYTISKSTPCRRARHSSGRGWPFRANPSLLYGEEEGAGRIRTVSDGSHGTSASEEGGTRARSVRGLFSSSNNTSSSDEGADSSFVRHRRMRSPSFHPVDTSVPSRGCMRVRTLEESLLVCVDSSQAPDASSRDESVPLCTSSGEDSNGGGSKGFLGRLSPRRGRSVKAVLKSNMESNSNRSVELGTVRFGRTETTRVHSIQYGNVEIREYSNTLGDHPACSEGPPISLDWAFCSRPFEMSIDEYEACRAPRKSWPELSIPKHRRERILVNLGYSYEEILQAVVDKRCDQIARERTLYRLRYQAFDERMEGFRLLRSARFCSRTRA
mmetsp:Transcript_23993/g.51935  ORF Transcript_23993/g.51935 Transcript_23993/m.51935 type:complete len:418 (+) Transcript_23993:1563-2816(+)